MAKSPSVTVVLEDSTGRRSPVTVSTQNANGVNEFRGLAKALASSVDNLSDCVVVDFYAQIHFDPTIFTGLKAVAAESDVENKAFFGFESTQGFASQVTIPGVKASIVDDDTNLIDISHPNVAAFVTAMTSNFVDNALNIVPTNSRDEALTKLTAAYQQFRRSRKKRSAIRKKA
jgi:hypothetical protein